MTGPDWDEASRAGLKADEFDRDWIRAHVAEERRGAAILGDIREAIFGVQDGLVSTVGVVSAVAAATDERFLILVAGIVTALAGMFSMAAGEYLSSKSQREVFDAQIAGEREEVETRPGEAEAEVAYMFEEDGLPPAEAAELARVVARHPDVLLRTMVEKELALHVDEHAGSPLQGALVMGGSFGLGAAVPVIPYLLLTGTTAIWVSLIATGAVLFGVGVLKSRWTRRGPVRSGLEILAVGAAAGIVGYVFGNILPPLLGAPPVGA
ncbi:MAG TPA: VIT1/CCC1 transporter family protein [Candidatus Limnocylindria bacterium]|nr:VIT1/CCC1 transporter family protein [Candidatus Limnocylindria bacterium]